LNKLFKIIIILSFYCHQNVEAQQADSLLINLIKTIQRGENDSVRFAANENFRTILISRLEKPSSFNDKLENFSNLSVQTAPDNSFRLITWLVPFYNGAYQYYGFIQQHNITTEKDSLIELTDSTNSIDKIESVKLNPSRWFGAVYYSITEVKKGKTKYYVLLGWKGKNKDLSQKVIEVLTFSKNKIVFGAPVFKKGSVWKSRVLFSFNSQAAMTLKYDDSKNRIVFDHIATPKQGDDNGIIYQTGPDGTYDAFKLKKGKWILQTDIDARTR
jgi:hypothetical protein